MTASACAAVSRGLLQLDRFDNSARWWMGASVALAQSGFTSSGSTSDAELATLWTQLHAQGKV